MDIVDQLVKVALLGATWVLYLLFFLSVASVAAMVERWRFYRGNDRATRGLHAALRRAIEADDEDAIEDALRSGGSVQAGVLRHAFAFRSGGPAAFADAVDGALAQERQRLDRGTTLLGTIGNNAPFVGLFGTVLGIIEAFTYLSVADGAGMDRVMSGISEALVATAVGLAVAIPAVVGYNMLTRALKNITSRTTSLGHAVVGHLRASTGGKAAA
jgi:biopolymer transport protein ExbB/TolQ